MPPQNSWPLPEAPPTGFGAVHPSDDLAALRKLLAAKAGIDPGTPLDVASRIPEQVAPNFDGGGMSGLWDYLAKDPHQAPPGAAVQQAPTTAPFTGNINQDAATKYKPLGPNQFDVPAGYDANRIIRGSASFGGPKLNNNTLPAALEGLKAAGKPPTQSYSGPPMGDFGGGTISEDFNPGDPYAPSAMARSFGQDPSTTAPGSSTYWGSQIKEREGDEAFQTALAQQQQKSISEGQTQQNPAIQAALQQQADRSGLGIAKVQAGATAPYYSALANQIGAGSTGGRDIRSISRNGITYGPEQQLPPTLYAQLTRDRANASVQDSFGRVNPQAKAAFDQTAENVINAYPVDNDIKDLVRVIRNDPSAAQAPDTAAALQMIAATHGLDLTAILPDEMQMIDQLFQLVKP